MTGDSVRAHLEGLAHTALRTAAELSEAVDAIAAIVIATFERGNKLMFCGNGGSAADAQHLATEYVVRFRGDRLPLPAIALTTDTSLLTAAANDLGFENVFARQVQALGAPGDILFLHTTSGQSPNLLAAARAARAAGVICVGMLARGGGALRSEVDHAVIIPTDDGAHAQELHLAVGHAICGMVDAHSRARTKRMTASYAPDADTLRLLHAARLAEKRQALFYRRLAAAAEDVDDAGMSERMNGLHADEQHHLSRLTVRLVELGEPVADLGGETAPAAEPGAWEEVARAREGDEIARYEELLQAVLDAKTRTMIEEFLVAERGHAETLDGKWMGA